MPVNHVRTILILCGIALAACTSLTPRQGQERGPDLQALINAEVLHYPDEVSRFYAGNGEALVWTGADNRENLRALIRAVRNSASHGLTPEHYHPSIVGAARRSHAALQTDAFLTDIYFTLAQHMKFGKVDPVTVESTWNLSRAGFDAPAHLRAALRDGQVAESLEALAPTHAEYQRLRAELARYRALAQDGTWTAISTGATLHPGDRNPRVVELRARLEATGDLAPDPAASDLFTTDLEQVIKAYQRRTGLEADGIVGAETLAHLNQGPLDRIAQLRVSLERWRWLPADMGERHIRVNIAGFQLETWEHGERVSVHEAIVGRTYRRTPVFSASLQYMVLNPWWETPPSIAVQDKLPQFRQHPEVIAEMGYEIRDAHNQVVDATSIDWNAVSASAFPYRIRQAPGPLNALGQVKFIFPNAHNVYIHDTPTRDLFQEGRRNFSSGCIRVADPLSLADWLFQADPIWSREEIRRAVDTGAETRVDLVRRIPVHILYFTAVVGSDGRIRFLDDIYQRDARVVTALNTAPGEDETTSE